MVTDHAGEDATPAVLQEATTTKMLDDLAAITNDIRAKRDAAALTDEATAGDLVARVDALERAVLSHVEVTHNLLAAVVGLAMEMENTVGQIVTVLNRQGVALAGLYDENGVVSGGGHGGKSRIITLDQLGR